MLSETFMMRNNEVHDLCSNGGIPAEIAETLKDFFLEHGDLSYEEVLQQQEIVYQSIQANGRNKGRTSDNGQSSDWSQFSGQEGASSRGGSIESQLALDEALARSLQELGEDFDDFYISGDGDNAAGTTEVGTRETPVGTQTARQDVRQDDVDPDNMTYEQLQSLGETVGTESKGLSEEMISQLRTFEYKTGSFLKKKKNEECVICWMAYKKGVLLTCLPCAHQYHTKCIRRWLKLNKQCPVCKAEVRDD